MGAYGGRLDVMKKVAPVGPVYQAGTLSGNPVAMAAGLTQLKILADNPEIYEDLNKKSSTFFEEAKKVLREAGLPYQLNHIGSLGCIFFTPEEVKDYESAKTADTEAFRSYFKYMLQGGIHMAPSQFEAMFISAAHDDAALEETLAVMKEYFSSCCSR